MTRKREDLAKLSADKSRESIKISPLENKILSSQSAIGRTKSEQTIKSKMNEIERAEKALADIDKKIADIDKKVATKEKEYAAEEKNTGRKKTD
jgi:predicted  nucleic acid-binding Zn-ribbon protein